MVDQVAIFFLAGHETSASALGWALYLLASHPEVQERVAAETAEMGPEFSALSRLRLTRDVFREALRLDLGQPIGHGHGQPGGCRHRRSPHRAAGVPGGRLDPEPVEDAGPLELAVGHAVERHAACQA